MIKNCLHCSKPFQSKRKDAKYCSDGCRQMEFRKRNDLPAPEFLKSKQNGLGNVENSEPITPKPERIPNQEYLKLTNRIKILSEKKELVFRQKQDLIKAFCQVSGQNPTTKALLEGAALGGGLAYVASNPKEKTDNAIGGVFMGAVLWALLTTNDADQKKQVRLNEIKSAINRVNEEIDSIQLSIFQVERMLSATPKTVYQLEAANVHKTDPLKSYLNIQTPQAQVLTNSMRTEPLKAQETPILNAKELSQVQFKTIPFKGVWAEFIGQPEFGFSLSIYGQPGQGKSTFAIILAKYLSENHGKILLNSSEEKHSKTLQEKLIRLNAANELILISTNSTISGLREQMKNYPSPFVIIDSIDHMKATPEDIENLKKESKGVSFILIHQVTKDGKQRGSNEFAHNSDMLIRIENGAAITEKNRFAQSGKRFEIPFVEAVIV